MYTSCHIIYLQKYKVNVVNVYFLPYYIPSKRAHSLHFLMLYQIFYKKCIWFTFYKRIKIKDHLLEGGSAGPPWAPRNYLRSLIILRMTSKSAKRSRCLSLPPQASVILSPCSAVWFPIKDIRLLHPQKLTFSNNLNMLK